jgi:hypothetical protein
MLTLVSWIEHGNAPDRIIASGANFSSPPAARSRPLCPYPQEVRYVGPSGVISLMRPTKAAWRRNSSTVNATLS